MVGHILDLKVARLRTAIGLGRTALQVEAMMIAVMEQQRNGHQEKDERQYFTAIHIQATDHRPYYIYFNGIPCDVSSLREYQGHGAPS